MNPSIPYGLSFHKDMGAPKTKRTLFIRMPIFIYHARKYDINKDNFIAGWWKLNVLISFDVFYSGFGFRVMHGWVL
jgi:hypothetical protein